MVAGLANRMCQYALYKNLEYKGIDVYIDDTYQSSKWLFENVDFMTIFPNSNYRKASQEHINRMGGGDDIVSKVRRKYKLLSNKHFVKINCTSDGFIDNILSMKGDHYLSGLWLSEKYFNEVAEIIWDSFKFKEFEDSRNLLLQNEMQSCESVAIHVRKGADYNNSVNANVCGIDYYNIAINHIRENVTNPVFYVFSDNKEWVKDHFKSFKYQLIDWNPTAGNQNYLDMQLMSNAKHNIISNSSYSWWGAWLNNNKAKICIMPLLWFNPQLVEKTSVELDIAPANWIAL